MVATKSECQRQWKNVLSKKVHKIPSWFTDKNVRITYSHSSFRAAFISLKRVKKKVRFGDGWKKPTDLSVQKVKLMKLHSNWMSVQIRVCVCVFLFCLALMLSRLNKSVEICAERKRRRQQICTLYGEQLVRWKIAIEYCHQCTREWERGRESEKC